MLKECCTHLGRFCWHLGNASRATKSNWLPGGPGLQQHGLPSGLFMKSVLSILRQHTEGLLWPQAAAGSGAT